MTSNRSEAAPLPLTATSLSTALATTKDNDGCTNSIKHAQEESNQQPISTPHNPLHQRRGDDIGNGLGSNEPPAMQSSPTTEAAGSAYDKNEKEAVERWKKCSNISESTSGLQSSGSTESPSLPSQDTVLGISAKPPLLPPPPPPPPQPPAATSTTTTFQSGQHHTTLSSDQIVGMIADVTSSSPILSGQVVKKGRFNVMLPVASSTEDSDHSTTTATTANPSHSVELRSMASSSLTTPTVVSTTTAYPTCNTSTGSTTQFALTPIDGSNGTSAAQSSDASVVTKKGRFVVTTLAPTASSEIGGVPEPHSTSIASDTASAATMSSSTNTNSTSMPRHFHVNSTESASSAIAVPAQSITSAPTLASSTTQPTMPPTLVQPQAVVTAPLSTVLQQSVPIASTQVAISTTPLVPQQLGTTNSIPLPLPEPQAVFGQPPPQPYSATAVDLQTLPPFAIMGQPTVVNASPPTHQISVPAVSLPNQPTQPTVIARNQQPSTSHPATLPPSQPPNILVNGQSPGLQPIATLSQALAPTLAGQHPREVPATKLLHHQQMPSVVQVAAVPMKTELLHQNSAVTTVSSSTTTSTTSNSQPYFTTVGYSTQAAGQAVTGQPQPAFTVTASLQQHHQHGASDGRPMMTTDQVDGVQANLQQQLPFATTTTASQIGIMPAAMHPSAPSQYFQQSTTLHVVPTTGSQTPPTPSSPDPRLVQKKVIGDVAVLTQPIVDSQGTANNGTPSRALTGHASVIPQKLPTRLTNQGTGFGKMFFFLEQMKLEVADADSTIKSLQRDLKLMRDKNRELETKNIDLERKLYDEKLLREATEAKARLIGRKYRELKNHTTAKNDPAMTRHRVYSEDDDVDDLITEKSEPGPLSAEKDKRAAETFEHGLTGPLSESRGSVLDGSGKLKATICGNEQRGAEYLHTKPKRSSFDFIPSVHETSKPDFVTHRRAYSCDLTEGPACKPTTREAFKALPMGATNGQSIASGLLPPLDRSSSGSRKNDGGAWTGTSMHENTTYCNPVKSVTSSEHRDSCIQRRVPTVVENHPVDTFIPRSPQSGQQQASNYYHHQGPQDSASPLPGNSVNVTGDPQQVAQPSMQSSMMPLLSAPSAGVERFSNQSSTSHVIQLHPQTAQLLSPQQQPPNVWTAHADTPQTAMPAQNQHQILSSCLQAEAVEQYLSDAFDELAARRAS